MQRKTKNGLSPENVSNEYGSIMIIKILINL